MKIYIGNEGKLKALEFIKQQNLGVVYLANAWRTPKKGIDWILDNGAYSCWLNKKQFDENAFDDALIKIERINKKPDFIVVPDIVAGGMKSLYFSLKWVHRIPAAIPGYLAVQDGMTTRDVLEDINFFDGVFVGGTVEWKFKTAKTWVDLAQSQNMKCHIGRVGTLKKLLWAKHIGADSVDSSNFAQNNTYGVILNYQNQQTLDINEIIKPLYIELFGDDFENDKQLGVK